jgi:hypothetical protein
MEAQPSSALAIAGPTGGIVSRQQVVDRLRQEREAHRHNQIWTKDAHGGPYRKVGAKPEPAQEKKCSQPVMAPV